MLRITQVILFLTLVVSLSIAANLKNGDEGRPYEFGFTIDGQQHRHEKKDEKGIIQGEFGFITADGIYHTTVYATDENGDFKILSMKSLRISAPLDGSSFKGTISPEANKYRKQAGLAALPEPSPSPNALSLPEETPKPVSTTTVKTKEVYKFTTLPTVKPACAGCGYITTQKPKPGQKFQFQNAFVKVETPVQPKTQVQQPAQPQQFNQQQLFNERGYDNQPGTPQSTGQAQPGQAGPGQNQYDNQMSIFGGQQQQVFNQQQEHVQEGYPSQPGQPQLTEQAQPGQTGPAQQLAGQGISTGEQPQLTGQAQPGQTGPAQQLAGQGISTGGQPQLTGQAQPGQTGPAQQLAGQGISTGGADGARNQNQLNQGSYPNQQGQPQLTGQGGAGGARNQNQFIQGRFDGSQPSYPGSFNPSAQPAYDSGLGQIPSQGPQPNALGVPNPEEIRHQIQQEAQDAVSPNGQSKSPEYPSSSLPPIEVKNNVINVGGANPLQIPIKDKFPGMEEGLPEGVSEKDITDLLYKFSYVVGFHGHYEKGLKNGAKVGGYFVNGRDGFSRVVTYVADENGYRPKTKLINLGLDSDDTPKPESEKTFGLKSFEFVWYPIK